ncbi:hypothetical protein [Bifidobacterium leontopitheci]|uniref:Uncharacterized protein n=1 Tax=Bifidobacterium leontopitheci TaxID=2650774 RepID=A0A6I1GG11_9BIFI|nr:hypothetical protein [Bifidobacterium leontopitheci]KAB7790574.1 hypothetical protein F7D09_0943 [Bifidobacterium leontopitheci]
MGKPRQDGKEAVKFWVDSSLKDELYRDIGRGRRFETLTELMIWLVEGYVNGQEEQEAPQRRERMPQGNPNGLESVMLDSPELVSSSGERPTGQVLRKPRRRMSFGEENGNEYR